MPCLVQAFQYVPAAQSMQTTMVDVMSTIWWMVASNNTIGYAEGAQQFHQT